MSDGNLIYDESEHEDTSFVSIADFFSLLSIAFIYFAVSFGNPLSSPTVLIVESVAESGSGPAMPIDATVANVSLLHSEKEGLIVRVVAPGGDRRSDLYVRAMNDPMTRVPIWALAELETFDGVKHVVLYMSVEDVDIRAYQLRDRIGSVLSQRFDVRIVFE